MKRLLILLRLGLFLLVLIPCSSFAVEGSIQITKGLKEPITLQKALSWALMQNPELEAFSFEQRAREAHALQSGLYPNPQLEILVEDAAGSGNFNGFSRSQSTIQLSQLIELGGKRGARLRANDLSGKLAGWDYETKRMDVLTRSFQSLCRCIESATAGGSGKKSHCSPRTVPKRGCGKSQGRKSGLPGKDQSRNFSILRQNPA